MSPTRIRQSDLEAYSRCAQQKKLYNQVEQGLLTPPGNLSATVFGTVVHHALQTLESLHHQGRADALKVALATFEHYWKPENLVDLEPGGIQVWLPRQTYGGLRTRGLNNLRAYWEVLKADDGLLMALEHTFEVPVELAMPTGPEVHTLTGTVDRLSLRTFNRKPYLSVDDFKSGKKSTYLRYKTQWTVYSYASLHPEFWADWGDMLDPMVEALHRKKMRLYVGDECPLCRAGTHDPSPWLAIPRRGRWISIRDTFGVHDTGWRLPNDYARLLTALVEYVRANELDVFPLTMSGDTCTYCPFNNGICGNGVPLADEKELPQWK